MNGIGKEFMERTKFQYAERSDQSLGYPQPPLQSVSEDEGPVLDLPDPKDIQVDRTDLREAIESRTSTRNYRMEPISLEELSYLLWCTQGVKQSKDSVTFRTVPSAGARHALETYLLVNNVEGLDKGLYHFLPIEHELARIEAGEHIAEHIRSACLDQPFVVNSAVTFIWTAVPNRMKWRYGERGYRYLHLDVGHVCQNLYLSAQSVGCGVCAIAAFLDDNMNALLRIDGEKEFTIYIATVGKK
ncbi:SagB/ThcOx family dehydrogenase [Methanolobus halotolerans]|uniref:Nitroreductase n=1 Tax=Methanolobus halotolerans TaxID=2052935 RepID=A0A4E0PV60_9EURY|nr:SagB/ThcOx family dehydrogenase [Methanolobus halotolerans]TGC08979.1 nitroreductase [Methanolobus halotolerans]